MALTPRHQRYAIVAVLIFLVALQWLRTGSYAVDEHYVVYKAPVTSSDREQGVNSKPVGNGSRLKASMVMVCETRDLYDAVQTIKSVEDRFNWRYHYDWVFISSGVLTTEFKTVTSNLVSGKALYGYVPREEWSFPKFVDAEQSSLDRIKLAYDGVPMASELSYRHQQRYYAGFMANHTLAQGYDYFWRLDPGTTVSCDVNYDLFRLMKNNNKKYGFGASMRGNDKTNPSLFPLTHQYFAEHPDREAPENNAKFVDLDESLDVSYQGHCEFFTNWEILDLNFMRSKEYTDVFNHLDQSGGFFHEVWSANSVRSVITSMLLPTKQFHWFSDIGFSYKDWLSVCPLEKEVRLANKCSCDPSKSVTWNPKKYCSHKYFIVNKLERPDGWREQMNRDL